MFRERHHRLPRLAELALQRGGAGRLHNLGCLLCPLQESEDAAQPLELNDYLYNIVVQLELHFNREKT